MATTARIVTICQSQAFLGSVEANRDAMMARLDQALIHKPDLVCLPETFTTAGLPGGERLLADCAETVPGPTASPLPTGNEFVSPVTGTRPVSLSNAPNRPGSHRIAPNRPGTHQIAPIRVESCENAPKRTSCRLANTFAVIALDLPSRAQNNARRDFGTRNPELGTRNPAKPEGRNHAADLSHLRLSKNVSGKYARPTTSVVKEVL